MTFGNDDVRFKWIICSFQTESLRKVLSLIHLSFFLLIISYKLILTGCFRCLLFYWQMFINQLSSSTSNKKKELLWSIVSVWISITSTVSIEYVNDYSINTVIKNQLHMMHVYFSMIVMITNNEQCLLSWWDCLWRQICFFQHNLMTSWVFVKRFTFTHYMLSMS